MNPDLARLEPASAPRLQMTWLGHLGQPEDRFIELDRLKLTTFRHRALHVMNPDKSQQTSITPEKLETATTP